MVETLNLLALRNCLIMQKEFIFWDSAFHPTNVERLGLNKLRKKDKSLATGFGLTQREMGDIRTLVTSSCVAINEYNCIDFCRNTVNWS